MKVHKVVREHELEQHTLDGWEFVMHVSCQEQTPGDFIPGYWDGQINRNVPQRTENRAVIETPRFVVARDRELVAEDGRLLAAARAAESERAIAVHDLACARTQLTTLEKRAAAAEENADRLHTCMNESRAEAQEARTRMRVLEGDLGKLRTEIGAARCRELLGH